MTDGSLLFTVFSRMLGLMSRGREPQHRCVRVGYLMPVLYGTAQRRTGTALYGLEFSLSSQNLQDRIVCTKGRSRKVFLL